MFFKKKPKKNFDQLSDLCVTHLQIGWLWRPSTQNKPIHERITEFSNDNEKKIFNSSFEDAENALLYNLEPTFPDVNINIGPISKRELEFVISSKQGVYRRRLKLKDGKIDQSVFSNHMV